jgi:PAS domain S-box-containing protein
MATQYENPPKLEEIGSRAIVTVGPDTPMSKAVALMDERRISCLVVVDQEIPVGILTERDLVRNISRDTVVGFGTVGNFMSRPPITAPQGMPYLEGYHRCAEHGVRHLILVDDAGRLAGIVTETDFMEHLGLDAYIELKPVSSVMTKVPVTVSEGQSLREALSLMSVYDISCVVVARDNRPVGILSERDVVHLSQSVQDFAGCPLSEVMSAPVVTVRAEESLHKAASRMRKRGIRRLIVVDQGEVLAGIVTEHDLVKGLESRYTAFLRQIIARQTKELYKAKRRLNENLVLEHILRASLDMVIVATDTEGVVRYFNPAAESVFQIRSSGAIGKPLANLCTAAGLDAPFLESGVRTALTDGSCLFQLERRQGDTVQLFRCRIATIADSDGQVLGFVHTLSDISAKKKAAEEQERLQAELLQARKMEAIGQLTAGISHDFNNILASVLGYTCLALDSADVEDGGEVEECLLEIHKAGKRAQALVGQLLTFSRSSPQHRQSVSIASLIEEITRMLRATLPATVELRLELVEDVPPVFVDPVQVQQLVVNLVLNARDAIDGHGTVTVGLRNLLDVDAVSAVTHRVIRGDWVEVWVADNGCGMAAEVLEQSFEPFFTTKEVGKGSGMGLAVVHGIVTQNGGEVLVESEPGKGTVFRILLSPSKTMETDRGFGYGPPGTKRAPGRQLRILVVDDDAPIAAFVGKLLEKRGHVPVLAADGQSALERFYDAPGDFDLVITDHLMPELTGSTLAARIQTQRPELPIIVLTAAADRSLFATEHGFGRTTILSKPIEPEDLFEAIASLCR